MAQATRKKKTAKRQPTKRKLPSSSVKKKAPTSRQSKPRTISINLTRNKILQLSFEVKTTKKRNKSILSKASSISIALIFIGLLGFVYSGWRVFNQPVLSSLLEVSTVPHSISRGVPPKDSLPASDAIRLEIAEIAVNAPVAIVSKKADGSMQVPSNPSVVGQYKHAPTPGQIGPAIIVGHVDSMGGPAVFWRLRQLRPGQLVKITRVDGSVVTFKVDIVKNFSQSNFPTEEVYGNINYSGLRLITCGGTFDFRTRHYSDNTVVFASRIND